jgi:hypothetical protein
VVLTGLNLTTVVQVLLHLHKPMDARDKISLQRSQSTQDEDTARVAAASRHPGGVVVDRSQLLVQVDEFAEYQRDTRTITRRVATQCAHVSRRDIIVSGRALRQLRRGVHFKDRISFQRRVKDANAVGSSIWTGMIIIGYIDCIME